MIDYSNKVTQEYYYSNPRKDIFGLIPKNIKSILDVGCGDGAFLDNFDVKKCEVYGIEPVKSVFEKNKKDDKVILNNSVEEAIQILKGKRFEIISFNDVLEHLLYPDKVLVNVKVLLDEKGYVVASIPNVRFIKNFLNFIFRADWKYEDAGVLDYTHFRFFTKKSIERLFLNSGYKIETIKGINGPRKTYIRFMFLIFDLLTLFLLRDVKYLQFFVLAKPIK